MDERFQVLLTGRFLPGKEEEDIKLALEKMFRINRAKVDQILSTPQFVIKRDLNYQTSLKYQSALKSAGLFSLIKPMEQVAVQSPLASVTNKPAANTNSSEANSTPGENRAQSPNHLVTGSGAETNLITNSKEKSEALGNESFSSTIELAPVGADFREGKEQHSTPDAPDVSHLSVAKAGVVIIEHEHKETPQAPDVSHLSMTKVGEPVADKHIKDVPEPPDTSHLDLREKGGLIKDQTPKNAPAPPDTSHLDLANPGVRMSDDKPKKKIEPVDISHLKLDS